MPKPKLKHYVEFLYLGIMFENTGVKKIKVRDSSKVTVPKDAYGYRFFDILESRCGNETLKGNPKNYSGAHYFGKVMTLDDVKREVPDSNSLQKNMINNNYDRVVKTRMGNFLPLKKEDMVIAE